MNNKPYTAVQNEQALILPVIFACLPLYFIMYGTQCQSYVQRNVNGQDFEMGCRANSRFAPRQCERVLLCNDVSHWLGASLESTPWWLWGKAQSMGSSITLNSDGYIDKIRSQKTAKQSWKYINDIISYHLRECWWNWLGSYMYRYRYES